MARQDYRDLTKEQLIELLKARAAINLSAGISPVAVRLLRLLEKRLIISAGDAANALGATATP